MGRQPGCKSGWQQTWGNQEVKQQRKMDSGALLSSSVLFSWLGPCCPCSAWSSLSVKPLWKGPKAP